MSSREEFEALVLEARSGLTKGHLKKDENGNYINFPVQCYWFFFEEAWNKSRAALVVDIGEGNPASEFREGANVISIAEAIIRIEAAGVQVKS